MRHAGNFLFDDGAFIQVHGDIMAGGSDQLYAPKERLMIGLRADKSREKGMMDIDNAVGIRGNEVFGQDLHVTGEHDQFDSPGFKFAHLCGFLPTLAFRSDRKCRNGTP